MGKVVALYNFDPTKGDELQLQKGDVVSVEERSDDGWWRGSINGRSGWFPGNYTEPIEEPPAYNESAASFPTPSAPPSTQSSKPLQVVIAMFAFAAESLDELSFCEGERLDILDYSTKDWWTARNVAGKVGLIPNNHVRGVATGASLTANLRGPYANKRWYYGNPDRHLVDEVLQGGSYGDYLIRDSATRPGNYSMAACSTSVT
ncbi:hypothetical protein L596_015377 [Steinernema carpocapsae]|uniref:SH3 domain-containing protein n=1 Tax=Steinernema carpocapsae TaxID=34508 RepID=A0A4U5NF02_STECR|nr:hypothetical protein L596_015377 [Steinernema carpocapsae]